MIPLPPGGTVRGVGIDLTDVARIRRGLERYGERFARKFLTDSEAAYCLAKADPAPFVAARFAAKEAVVKALGGGCLLREIEVVRAESGAPSIQLIGRAADRAAGGRVLISLTHLDEIAGAVAMLVEGECPGAGQNAGAVRGS